MTGTVWSVGARKSVGGACLLVKLNFSRRTRSRTSCTLRCQRAAAASHLARCEPSPYSHSPPPSCVCQKFSFGLRPRLRKFLVNCTRYLEWTAHLRNLLYNIFCVHFLMELEITRFLSFKPLSFNHGARQSWEARCIKAESQKWQTHRFPYERELDFLLGHNTQETVVHIFWRTWKENFLKYILQWALISLYHSSKPCNWLSLP